MCYQKVSTGRASVRTPSSIETISLSVLESSFEDERVAEKSLESFGALLNGSSDAYPEAFVAYLRLEKGVAVLKSSKENLLRNRDRIEKIDYPFLLIEAVDSNSWQACDFKSCFAYSKDMERVIEAVEKR